jgi:hypothetical protein
MKRRQFLTAPGALALVATILLGSTLVWSRVSSAAGSNQSSVYLPSIRIDSTPTPTATPSPTPTPVANHFGVIVGGLVTGRTPWKGRGFIGDATGSSTALAGVGAGSAGRIPIAMAGSGGGITDPARNRIGSSQDNRHAQPAVIASNSLNPPRR